MKTCFDEIRRLTGVNAKHRKGFRLKSATPMLATDHAFDEACELREAVRGYTRSVAAGNQNKNAVKLEMADVLGCIYHLAIMLDISEADLSSAVLQKLAERFSEEEP